ncbi:serine/arginine repetitive matrix protein 1 isoform X2 [Osmerus eperlanus]|uniref:serine/arginine repetitive matrix protein 1 isoform X2 n=1 Tax=Osmerus eperlanus TaxID=29151 RepID=UPI002E136FDC
MERDLISQTQPEHGGTSKESSGGTSFQPLTSITTRISANATGTPIPPRLTPNPTLKPPTLTPISSSPPPPLTPAPSFPASLTPKTATPPALIPFPPKLTPTPNLPLPTQTLHLLPTSAMVTTPPSSSATSPPLTASPLSLTPSSASTPITSLPPSTVTHNNVNSSSPKTSSVLTNGKTRPPPTPTSTPITPFHTPASPTGKQLSESHSLGSPRPVPSNQSTPPVSRVSQKALLLGKRLQSSRRDQLILTSAMQHVPSSSSSSSSFSSYPRPASAQLQNLTLRPPPPGTLNIPSSLRLKPPSSAPPPLPLPRPRTPIFPPLRPRPHPTSTATDSQTTPSQHLSVPPPTLYSSVRSVPLRPRLHSPSNYRAVPPRQSPALRPIAAATAKHAPPMKRLWTGLASCPSSPSQLRPSQSQHISLSSSHPLNSTSCFERSPSAARQLQIIALSSGRQSQPSNSAHAHASVQSQPSDSAHAHASVQSQPSNSTHAHASVQSQPSDSAHAHASVQSQPSNSAHAHASVQSQPSVQDSPQLVGESQRTLSAEKYNPHPPKAPVCKTPSTLPSAPSTLPSAPSTLPSAPSTLPSAPFPLPSAPALLSPPAPCLQTSPPNPSQKQKEEEGTEGAREAAETRRESHRVREEREGAREAAETRRESHRVREEREGAREAAETRRESHRVREEREGAREAAETRRESHRVREEREGAREAAETRRESHRVREEREGARERSGEDREVGEMEDHRERGTTAEMDGERERTAEDKVDQKKERPGGEERMEGAEDRRETCQEDRGGEWMDVDRSHTQSKSQTGFPQQHCHVEPNKNQDKDQCSTSPNQTLLDPAKKTQSIDKVNLCESLSAQSDNLSALSSLSSQSPPSSPPILPPPDSPPPHLPALSTHLSSPPSLSQAQPETFSESQPGPWAQKVWPEGGRRVLTHLVEGFVIQEGLQPFPVNRSSLLVQEEVCVTQNSNGANGVAHVPLTDTIAPPSDHSSDSDEEGGATDDPMTLRAGPREKKAVLYCQFCAKRGHAHNFMRSKRFCSTACARGYNVGLTKRLRALSAGSRAEGRSSSSGLKRAMSVPGKPLLLRLPRDLWSAHRHDHKDEEEEDPAVSMTTRLGRRAGRRRERRASEPAMTSEPCVTSLLRPAQWSVEQVCDFINTLQGCGEVSEAFRLQEIDGQALLLLTEDHLMTSMNIKLGPALKICAHINTLKHP